MTTQEQIQFIKQKAIEANPDIKELEFGCKLTVYNKTYFCVEKTEKKSYDTIWALDIESPEHTIVVAAVGCKIIGRDIRLADVLNALKEKTNGELNSSFFEDITHSIWKLVYQWNLLKDRLEDQSPETIEFIYNLLK